MKRQYPEWQVHQEQAVKLEGQMCAMLDAVPVEGWVYTTENCGTSIQRAWLYPNPLGREVTQDEVAKLRRCVGSVFPGVTLAWTRKFREKDGTFYWQGEAKGSVFPSGTTEVWVMIEHAPAGKCTIRKVTKEVTVFETDCKPESE